MKLEQGLKLEMQLLWPAPLLKIAVIHLLLANSIRRDQAFRKTLELVVNGQLDLFAEALSGVIAELGSVPDEERVGIINLFLLSIP